MRFGILGPLQVIGDDGRELALGGRMPRAVLALLLLRANEVVSSDQLVEELWAGAPPASGAKGLHVHVSRLRRALAAGHIDPDGERLVTTAGGYVLRVALEELDVQRCERLIGEGRSLLAAGRPAQALAALSGAVELWRGDVLADFQYDAFAQGEIARLGELRAAVLEERIAVEMRLGREAQVLGELERLVRDHPYRERLRGQLMLSLYRTGRQAEALAAISGSRLSITNDPSEAVSGAQAVYTDVWTSMGQEAEKAKRLADFAPYQVNAALFEQAAPEAIFLHCLPAKRGEEVVDQVIECSQSAVFDQAENRLHVQKALLLMLLG